MLLGIDVGGTFTDGVVVEGGRLMAQAKHPTQYQDLKQSLWAVLDELLSAVDRRQIERAVLSTTLITNLLATNQGRRTALIMIPGHGLPEAAYDICPDQFFVSGFMDFRGREIEAVDDAQVMSALQAINLRGINRVAVAGKFSNRNDSQENAVYHLARRSFPDMDVYLSSKIACRLNFPRRAATAYYTAMIQPEWNAFIDEVETALQRRGLGASVEVLKADGGTMSLPASRTRPCETIFSGPAASTMGALALAGEAINSVVVDIGGTTSDLALLVEGKPLYADRGAAIAGRLTHIRSLAIRSVPLGGDSALQAAEPLIQLRRLGPAACWGGSAPTVIDAFNLGLELNLGDVEASYTQINCLSQETGQSPEHLCAEVIRQAVSYLSAEIQTMFKAWELEPAYKVWEVVHQKQFVLHRVIGIGAAAGAMIPLLAQALGVDYICHPYAPVANGLGAALVRPTLAVEVHIDTERKTYAVTPEGRFGTIPSGKFQLTQAQALARACLEEAAASRGMADLTDLAQCYVEEQFNVVQGYSTVGKIFDIGLEIAPGFVGSFPGEIE
jgi:N-methylhydantoinase A/oxoprolinase/acetone carboxylase beta subunit